MLCRVFWQKLDDISEVFTTVITLMIKTASTSKTSVNLYPTVWRNIPEAYQSSYSPP
jgi:hypothetical protein